MDTSEYMSIFLDDTKENLQNLNESLLVLEKEPDNEEKLNEIFRVAHSIKGASATMEFSNMAELTHKMEDVLSKFRNKELNVTSNVLTVLFKCLDTLEKMVDNIEEENDDNIPIEDIINELLEISGKEKPVKKVQPKQNTNIEFKLNEYDINVINQAIEAKMNVFRVNINLEEDTLLKSARAFIIINNLDENGDIIKSSPSTEDIESENFEFTINLVYITEINKEEVMKIITSISDIKSVNIEKIENPKIDREKKSPVNDKIKTKSENKTKKKTDKRAHQSVRVELDRLDKFMNMVSELVINKTRLELIGNKYNIKELSEILEQISMTTTDLQEQVLKIRMLPLEQVFNKFPRMIRDLSVSLGREMELIIEGQDTELDRTVIDEIGEPLIHLIRNSADHGIESREDRIAKGKDPKGIIRLTAYQEGNSAIIKVADDGNGLNVDKIKQKAQGKGINTDGMSEDDINNLIFLQGFSTNDKVTEISGRGVGMDVVKTKISALGGSVRVESKKNQGSVFIIKLPLTLQIIQALLINVSDNTFAMSLANVERILKYKEEEVKKSGDNKVIIYKDKFIPIIKLSEKLNISSTNINKYVIITKVGEKKVGLVVDKIIGKQEIVIKPLGKTLKTTKNYIGATILGDGLVTLILDISSIIMGV